MIELPPESERLLALKPNEFVAERQRLARELRDAGRTEDAAAVASMSKPSAVVLAVNRAARDRPNAARDAAAAAGQLEKAQVGGDPGEFRAALGELEQPLDLLSEVALAHVGSGKGAPTEAMRRRVHDLVRRAVATVETRERLTRGALLEEEGATGFDAFAGMSVAPAARRQRRPAAKANQKEAERQKRVTELREDLKRAEQELAEASRAVRAAETEQARAERAVASVRAKLERLG